MNGNAALVEDGTVIHIAVCDEEWATAQNYIFITDSNSFEKSVSLGDSYDSENEVFIPQGWSYDGTKKEFVPPPKVND